MKTSKKTKVDKATKPEQPDDRNKSGFSPLVGNHIDHIIGHTPKPKK